MKPCSSIIDPPFFGSAFVCAASLAQAGTVTISQAEAGNTFGTPNLSVSVERSLTNENQHGGQNITLSAGAFRLNDGMNDFIAYCLEPGIGLDFDQDFDTMSNPLNATEQANVERLFEVAYTTSLTSATNSAAFQVAIWEIVTDNFSFDLDAGDHQIADPDGVKEQADEYFALMADMGVSGQQYRLNTFVNDGQDLVSATPVPLPAGGLLLVTALGGLALRRRAAAK